MKACVLLRCRPGTYREVAKRVQSINDVKIVFPSLGRWELVLKLETQNVRSLANAVRRLRAIEEIEYSETLIELPGAE
jgi:hypothetical protein